MTLRTDYSFRSIVSERDSMATLTEQLREAIEAAGVTRYEISKQTGVSQSALSKFVLGQRGLSNKAMDAVELVVSANSDRLL